MENHDTHSLFDEFMPHGMCYMWRKDILILNVVSDILIALAYFSIPIFLYYFFRHRPNMPFRGVILMFSLFIFSCGITHLLGGMDSLARQLWCAGIRKSCHCKRFNSNGLNVNTRYAQADGLAEPEGA